MLQVLWRYKEGQISVLCCTTRASSPSSFTCTLSQCVSRSFSAAAFLKAFTGGCCLDMNIWWPSYISLEDCEILKHFLVAVWTLRGSKKWTDERLKNHFDVTLSVCFNFFFISVLAECKIWMRVLTYVHQWPAGASYSEVCLWICKCWDGEDGGSHTLYFSAGCEGTVPVWPHLPPSQPAGERLLWHSICWPRQTEGEYSFLKIHPTSSHHFLSSFHFSFLSKVMQRCV